ncbi:gp16 family protein [Pseudogulbenkiania sp. MAI-1]|uniref:gp16 family protein n=1 Tax=Pseudogulbenkiania sp. MAI-1 TaxID=990370 RepID=UPI00045E7DCE|nr:regulatory protein GemA [Pseudogulbenkiania sp. MAI-1]
MKTTHRPALLAKVHIARKELGLQDDAYRALLAQVTGKTSAKDLDDQALEKVLAHFKKCGWQPAKSIAKKHGQRPQTVKSREAYIDKIEALLADAGRHWSYAQALASRMFGVEKLEWCDDGQVKSVMVALEIESRRHGRGR